MTLMSLIFSPNLTPANALEMERFHAAFAPETVSTDGSTGHYQSYSTDLKLSDSLGFGLGLNLLRRYSTSENQILANFKIGNENNAIWIPHLAFSSDSFFFSRSELGLSTYIPLQNGLSGYADISYRRYFNANVESLTLGPDYEPAFGGLASGRIIFGIQNFDGTTNNNIIGGAYLKLTSPDWNKLNLSASFGYTREGILIGLPPASSATNVVSWSAGTSYKIWNENSISVIYENIRYPALSSDLRRIYFGVEIK